jgi:spore maturation protein SpmA
MLIITKKAACTRVPTTLIAKANEKEPVPLTIPITSVISKGISQDRAKISVRIMYNRNNMKNLRFVKPTQFAIQGQ